MLGLSPPTILMPAPCAPAVEARGTDMTHNSLFQPPRPIPTPVPPTDSKHIRHTTHLCLCANCLCDFPFPLPPSPRLHPAQQRLFAALRELDGSPLPYKAVPILPGGEHHLPGGRHTVRPFKTFHPVPSQGYCVFSKKNKLRPEYAGLPVRAGKGAAKGGALQLQLRRRSAAAFAERT